MKRSLLIDGVKVLASQLIVLHHLALYSPMTEWLAERWPALVDFMTEEGRLAVQPFLVIAGYLAAQSLSRREPREFCRPLFQRYLRLMPQLLIALLLVVGATWLVGDALAGEDWVSPLPSLGVFLAHVFFLQDILGIPSISAGAWYVAIDLQLFGLFLLLARWSRQAGVPLGESSAPTVVAVLTMASIHFFSRQPLLDAWALYYLSAYGLGALVAWARSSPKASSWLLVTTGLLLIDWASAPRERPLLALGTALLLYGFAQLDWSRVSQRLHRLIATWSDASYSVFVCHFAVIILVSGWWMKLGLDSEGAALGLFLLAWLGALLVGWCVWRVTEQALARRRVGSGNPVLR